MNSQHRFVDASSRVGRLRRYVLLLIVQRCSNSFHSEDYELTIRQRPERARVAGVKEKGKCSSKFCYILSNEPLDRKPVDPPPIIQLTIKDDSDPAQ